MKAASFVERSSHPTFVTEVLAGRTDLGLTPADPAPISFDNHEGVARAVLDGNENLAEQYARAVVMEVWQELGDI